MFSSAGVDYLPNRLDSNVFKTNCNIETQKIFSKILYHRSLNISLIIYKINMR